jgi:iron complex transport system substrate-binding protein
MNKAVVLLALALVACSPTPASEAPRQYPAIVSLNPCTDAILVEVADPAQILALSHYSQDAASSSMDLATARRFASTGGTVEEVLALHPDLTVSGNFMSPATVGAMQRLGLRLEQLPIASTVEASKAQVRALARLAGHPERGEALVARIEAALTAAAPPPDGAAASGPISAVVWQSGGMVPGGGTLIAELLRRTGFTSFSAARGMKQADVLPLEAMLADPPDLILTAGEPRANEDRLLAHPALAALADTRRERLDPSLLWCGGPTIIRAAERLAAVRQSL